MSYTNEQLKRALALMLPRVVEGFKVSMPDQTGTDGNTVKGYEYDIYRWKDRGNWPCKPEVLESEWLYACWLVEISLSSAKFAEYYGDLCGVYGPAQSAKASWQTRATHLMKIKGLAI
jgi:hypothetical protein